MGKLKPRKRRSPGYLKGFDTSFLAGLILGYFGGSSAHHFEETIKHPETHPRCQTPYVGIPCPPDCPNFGNHFDGCHICNCLRPLPKGRRKK